MPDTCSRLFSWGPCPSWYSCNNQTVHIKRVGCWTLSVGSNKVPDGNDLCFSVEDRRTYQVGVQPLSLDAEVHTVVSSIVLLSSWSSQVALTISAQQQIFFLLVDKDLINPKYHCFSDEADPNEVPLKATDLSLIIILVHASSSLSSWSICRRHSSHCIGFCWSGSRGSSVRLKAALLNCSSTAETCQMRLHKPLSIHNDL